MILVDTSIWIDHLRNGDVALSALLEKGRVFAHAFVIGELALGHLRQREVILAAMRDLPQATVATDAEVQLFIEQNSLAGLSIGYVDAHLLASVRLTLGSALWTRDKKLLDVAERMKLSWKEAGGDP